MAKYLVTILCGIAFIALILVLLFVNIPEYTNMTVDQVNAQTDRAISLEVAACQKAGGEWSVTMTAGGCNVTYPQPDLSWEIDPILNPAYNAWKLIQPGLIVGAIIDGFLLLVLFVVISEDRWIGRRQSATVRGAVSSVAGRGQV